MRRLLELPRTDDGLFEQTVAITLLRASPDLFGARFGPDANAEKWLAILHDQRASLLVMQGRTAEAARKA